MKAGIASGPRTTIEIPPPDAEKESGPCLSESPIRLSIFVMGKETGLLTIGSESAVRQMLHEGSDLCFAGGFGAGHASSDFFFNHLGPNLGKKISLQTISRFETVVPEQGHRGMARRKAYVGAAISECERSPVMRIRGVPCRAVTDDGTEQNHVARFHVPTHHVVFVSTVRVVGGDGEISVHHIRIVTRRDGFKALFPLV